MLKAHADSDAKKSNNKLAQVGRPETVPEKVEAHKLHAYKQDGKQKQPHEPFGTVFVNGEGEQHRRAHASHDEVPQDIVDFGQIYPRQVGGGHHGQGGEEQILRYFLFHKFGDWALTIGLEVHHLAEKQVGFGQSSAVKSAARGEGEFAEISFAFFQIEVGAHEREGFGEFFRIVEKLVHALRFG